MFRNRLAAEEHSDAARHVNEYEPPRRTMPSLPTPADCDASPRSEGGESSPCFVTNVKSTDSGASGGTTGLLSLFDIKYKYTHTSLDERVRRLASFLLETFHLVTDCSVKFRVVRRSFPNTHTQAVVDAKHHRR